MVSRAIQVSPRAQLAKNGKKKILTKHITLTADVFFCYFPKSIHALALTRGAQLTPPRSLSLLFFFHVRAGVPVTFLRLFFVPPLPSTMSTPPPPLFFFLRPGWIPIDFSPPSKTKTKFCSGIRIGVRGRGGDGGAVQRYMAAGWGEVLGGRLRLEGGSGLLESGLAAVGFATGMLMKHRDYAPVPRPPPRLNISPLCVTSSPVLLCPGRLRRFVVTGALA